MSHEIAELTKGGSKLGGAGHVRPLLARQVPSSQSSAKPERWGLH